MHDGHGRDGHREPHPLGGLHADLIGGGRLRESFGPLRQVCVGAERSPAPGEVGRIGLRIRQRLSDRGIEDGDAGRVAADERAEGPGRVGSQAERWRPVRGQFAGLQE